MDPSYNDGNKSKNDNGFLQWDCQTNSDYIEFSSCKKLAYINNNLVSHAKGTSLVRTSKPIIDGIHYWELLLHEPSCGAWVVIGLCHKSTQTYSLDVKNLLGDDFAWGLNYKGNLHHQNKKTPYCSPFYKENTLIGVEFDSYEGKLSFYKDGVHLGHAFQRLWIYEELYPAVCSTAAGTVVELVQHKHRLGNLQQICCRKIVRCIKIKENVDHLHLPNIIKVQLRDLF